MKDSAGQGDTASRRRGRPKGGSSGEVHDALLAAFGECLEEKAHSEITIKEVADRAGTSQEMVRYYFGGKDGLITAFIRERSESFMERLRDLERDILDMPGNPTRNLFATLVDLYLGNRLVYRISTSEFLKTKSAIREDFLDGRSELVIAHIRNMVLLLVEAGIYDRSVDPKHAALSIMTMVSGPVSLLSILPPDWVSVEELAGAEWIDHLTRLTDAAFRAPG